MTTSKIPIAVAHGDGIGPEIMQATLSILREAHAPLDIHTVEIGEKVYLKGAATGIEPKTWQTLRSTKAFLKAPVTTPQGGGFKSLNVTIRTSFGLFANVRPCISYYPFVQTKHPEMDVVIIRENEEDLYCGIEYKQTPNVAESLKIISRQGSEKIIRYAFEYARAHNRKKVTCFSKDNIMKIADGLFHQVFNEVAKEYPDIINEHWIVDIGAALLADTPEIFDVIVMPNLYGDILSDVGAQITGSVGLGGSANIGQTHAMFEAIHGSAPTIAGQDIANPSGLILASVLMLVHLGQAEIATSIHNAWLKTLEDGVHTSDIFSNETSKRKVGCQEFGQAVAENLGQTPQELPAVSYSSKEPFRATLKEEPSTSKSRQLLGVDVYLYSTAKLEKFIDSISHVNVKTMHLKMITNRGVRVWPEGQPETFCIEQWRCRFISPEGRPVAQADVIDLLHAIDRVEMDIIKTENLYQIDGKPGFSSAQG